MTMTSEKYGVLFVTMSLNRLDDSTGISIIFLEHYGEFKGIKKVHYG